MFLLWALKILSGFCFCFFMFEMCVLICFVLEMCVLKFVFEMCVLKFVPEICVEIVLEMCELKLC